VKDGLTGVHNRRYFLERLKAEFQHSQRQQTSSSLMIFDLDHFQAGERHARPPGRRRRSPHDERGGGEGDARR